MASNSAPEKGQQKDGAAGIATRAARPAKSTPAKKVPEKLIPIRPLKPAAKAAEATTANAGEKRAAKLAVGASTKVAAKPVNKPTKGRGMAKKGKTAKPDDKAKLKKIKMVRDSFTMPEPEYGLIAAVKRRCVSHGLAAKKSEVLRAAIIGFAAQSDDAITTALQALEVIKIGRPPKGRK